MTDVKIDIVGIITIYFLVFCNRWI